MPSSDAVLLNDFEVSLLRLSFPSHHGGNYPHNPLCSDLIPITHPQLVKGNDTDSTQSVEQMKEQVRRFPIQNEVSWILQREQLGTAHAVQQAASHFESKAEEVETMVVVASG